MNLNSNSQRSPLGAAVRVTDRRGSCSLSYQSIASALAICMMLSPTSFGADTVITVKDLVSQCAPALEKLEAQYGQIRAKGTYTFNNYHARVEYVDEFELAFDRKRQRLIRTETRDNRPSVGSDSELGVTRVTVATPDRCFKLKRKPGTTEFTTEWMGGGERDGYYKDMCRNIAAFMPMIRLPYFFPMGVPIARVVKHPSFVARSITFTKTGQIEGVRVEFEARPTGNRDDPLFNWRDSEVLSGWFVASPSRSWALHEFEFHHIDAKLEVTEKAKMEYRIGPDGLPLLKRAMNSSYLLDREIVRQTVEFAEIEHEPSPEENFSPAAFGIGLANTTSAAEPTLASTASQFSSPVYWLLVIAAISALGAIAFGYLWRRKSAGGGLP